MKLSPDIERLLWEVAESDNPKAYDEFQERFPELKLELSKRISMVRELRGARSPLATSTDIPRFEHRELRETTGPPQRAIWIGGGLALCALAAASFALTNFLVRKPNLPAAPPVVRVEEVQPQNPVIPNVSPAPNKTSNPPSVVENGPPPYRKPQTIKLERAPLLLALRAVAEQGQLSLEIAPNMPNPDIRLEYQGMDAIAILSDMGRRFGFTAFDEGNHKILIVPARDPNAPPDSPSAGSGHAEPIDATPGSAPSSVPTTDPLHQTSPNSIESKH